MPDDSLLSAGSNGLIPDRVSPTWGELITVEECHLDVWGHTNNVCYIQWMQDVAVGHSAAIGWDSKRYLDAGAIWVVRNHTVDYRRSTYLGNRILVQTWIEEMKSFSCLRRYRFVEVDKDLDETQLLDSNGFLHNQELDFPKSAILATASTKWAFISTETLRPVKIHQEIIDMFKTIVETGSFPSIK